jgi:5-methylcytosine-specific restriction endonuclease McrA
VSWAKLRREIYARDGGRCRACGLRVGRVWDAGHLVDRIQGGADTLDNLVLMCARCNRTLKPITPTRAEADAWLEQARDPPPIDWRSTWDLVHGRS